MNMYLAPSKLTSAIMRTHLIQFIHTNRKRFVQLIGICIVIEVSIRLLFFSTHMDIDRYRPSFYFSHASFFDRSRFISHPFMPYISRKNDKRIVHDYRPTIDKTLTYDYTNNSLGFRTKDRPFAKPPQTYRVITLGGSTTWDGPTNDTTWPSILEQKLTAYYQHEGKHVEVINLAIESGISAMSLTMLNFIGVSYQPDLVISYDGINDFMLSVQRDRFTPDYSNGIQHKDVSFSVQSMLPSWTFHSYAITSLSRAVDQLFDAHITLPYTIIPATTSQTSDTEQSAISLHKRNLKLMRATCIEYGCKLQVSHIGSMLEQGLQHLM